MNLGEIYGNRVIAPVVLNVPTDYASVSEALDYLDDKEIASGVIVEIKITDGIYSGLETISVGHENGNQIKITGNILNPAAVVLEFAAGSSGIVLSQGSHLRMLDGVTLKNSGTGIGVEATMSSSIYLGESVVIDSFNAGVVSSWGSTVQCDSVNILNCTTHGILAHRGSVYANNSSVSNSHYGVHANEGSLIQFESASVTGCYYGVRSLSGSYIDVSGSTISGNTINQEAVNGGAIGD